MDESTHVYPGDTGDVRWHTTEDRRAPEGRGEAVTVANDDQALLIDVSCDPHSTPHITLATVASAAATFL